MAPALAMATDRSRWIPYAFLGFFAVVLLANGAMIWLAFATWTGLETEGAYQKGLAYNRTLAETEAQRRQALHSGRRRREGAVALGRAGGRRRP